jgi:2-furoyl-CoA dehydrogenase FAD binding subunit
VRLAAPRVSRSRIRFQSMKPRPFDYARPDTVEEALALLAEYGDDARILAGGQSLIPMLNLRLIETKVLIDISRIAALDIIRDRGDAIEVGAAVTQNELMAWPQLTQKLPLVAAALPFVGHFQTRNRGTICGSIAHADPSSELPLVLALLGGAVVLRSQKSGERVVAAATFFKDMLTTARQPDELIAAVRFPTVEGKGIAFSEVARRHGDFAILALAAIADGRGAAQLGVAGMAGRPIVRTIDGDATAAVGEWAKKLEGYDDLHASAAMRRDILQRLGPRVVEEARKKCAA